jgi:hypothetical protein
MSFPFGDWQFWAVTASAAGAMWMLVRPFLGARAGDLVDPCSRCTVAAAAAAGAACRGGGGRTRSAGRRAVADSPPVAPRSAAYPPGHGTIAADGWKRGNSTSAS